MKGLLSLLVIPLFYKGTNAQDDLWKTCETFLAPSSVKGGGWGVYAGRDFGENEIIEIAPRHTYHPNNDPFVHNGVLNDYYHGGLRLVETQQVSMAAVVLGKSMFYNHHPEPNIRWMRFGKEPTKDGTKLSSIHGFVTKRKIEAGEELFITYGVDDGGKLWFEDRKLELVDVPAYESRKNGTVYEKDKEHYCSRVYSGMGRPTWENGILPSEVLPYKHNIQRLAPSDHPSAITKEDVTAGIVLEISPALIVSLPQIFMTPAGPMGFNWNDWDEKQQQDLRDLRASGDVKLQFQAFSTEWNRIDRFKNFEDVVVFPAAGNIAMVERVGKVSEANCMIEITSSGSMHSHANHGGGGGSAGIILKLVATKNLKSGDRLKLNIPSNSSPSENKVLAEELERSGQPVPSFLKVFLRSSVGNNEL